MRNSSFDRMLAGVVHWTNRQGTAGGTDGYERLLAAAFAMEKAMASLAECQACHTKAFLLAAKTHPKEEAISLLFQALKSSSLWLEAMIMLHWITFSRIKGMASFFAWQDHMAEKSEQVAEACKRSWTAVYSFGLAAIGLVEQIILHVIALQQTSPCHRSSEQQLIHLLEQLDDFFRICVRKADFWGVPFANQGIEGETVQREKRSMLGSTLQKLERYGSPSSALSAAFKMKLQDSVLPLKKYGDLGGSVRSVIETNRHYQAPWLNREVLPAVTKSHKVVVQSKKWKKNP